MECRIINFSNKKCRILAELFISLLEEKLPMKNYLIVIEDEPLGTGGAIKLACKKAKDKNDPFRLMGFGHRVYKNYDPRASVLKKSCHEVLLELGIKNDPLLDIAIELEKIALNDEYFISRKLFPNVDFYSGIIYKALGIPTSLFTVIFAVARSAGWIAQWKEMRLKKEPISRPRQLYTGAPLRDFVEENNR